VLHVLVCGDEARQQQVLFEVLMCMYALLYTLLVYLFDIGIVQSIVQL
jgi:hypothetical protein